MNKEPATAERWAQRIRRRLADTVEAIIGTGQEFIAAKKTLSHGEFQRLADLLNFTPRTIQMFMAIAKHQTLSNTNHGSLLPSSWRTLYELSHLEPPRLQLALERGEISPVIERKAAQQIVKQYKVIDLGEDAVQSEPEDEEVETNEEPVKETQQIELIAEPVTNQAAADIEQKREPQKLQTFNQVNDNIGWARWSWNPVTGCLHNCDYCYARDIAERFYLQKFEPTFFPERLDAPGNTKVPPEANGDPAWRRVFTCSMADLFGKWVPSKWIESVFDRIQQHQEWEFLCLTKFPQRLAKLDWPSNVWAGTTIDRQHRVEAAENAFSNVKAGVKWLSCEPLLEPLKFSSLAMFDWIVIGASTGSTLADPFAPPFEWVADLYEQARKSGCRVYLKHNLFGSSDGREPGMKPIREWPK